MAAVCYLCLRTFVTYVPGLYTQGPPLRVRPLLIRRNYASRQRQRTNRATQKILE